MPKQKQRSSYRTVPDSGHRGDAAKKSRNTGGYTQKEYLAEEKQRLLELVDQHSDRWKTIVRRYNACFGSHGRKRTEEGLKNKHSRMKKEEREIEMIRTLTYQGSLNMDGWGGGSAAPSQGPQSEPGDQMSTFASASSSGSDIVDLATSIPTHYVEYSLDGVYAECSSSELSSSPLNYPSTPFALADIAASAYGLESPDSMCSGWSAVDFTSPLTELRPSSVEPAWPCTLNYSRESEDLNTTQSHCSMFTQRHAPEC